MKITTSKTFTKYLNQEAKKRNIPYRFYHEKMSERSFAWYVSMTPENHMIDFDYNEDVFKTIRVEYPADYYACDRYLTTKDLNRCFSRSDKTADSFMDELFEEIEI